MKRLFRGLAALPLLAGTVLAQPMQLTDKQMDKVSAGFLEIDVSNTSLVVVSLFFRPYLLDETPNTIGCSTCYLLMVNPTFSVAAHFGQPATPPTTVP
jgi:hypothetical protein